MIQKGPTMDVSDINILQTIYSILSASGSRHLQFSLYEFRVFLISELRKRNIQIRILDEEVPLYAANEKVIIHHPDIFMEIMKTAAMKRGLHCFGIYVFV